MADMAIHWVSLCTYLRVQDFEGRDLNGREAEVKEIGARGGGAGGGDDRHQRAARRIRERQQGRADGFDDLFALGGGDKSRGDGATKAIMVTVTKATDVMASTGLFVTFRLHLQHHR